MGSGLACLDVLTGAATGNRVSSKMLRSMTAKMQVCRSLGQVTLTRQQRSNCGIEIHNGLSEGISIRRELSYTCPGQRVRNGQKRCGNRLAALLLCFVTAALLLLCLVNLSNRS